MKASYPLPAEPSLEELRSLRQLHRALDELLEESLKQRESLTQTFDRCFPKLLELTGARAIALTTRNEDLAEQTWTEGAWGERHPGPLLEEISGVRRMEDGTLVTQALDVGGTRVGSIGLLFPEDHTDVLESARLARLLETVAEQLDTVLCLVHTAAEKHQLIVQCNRHLANPVFEVGMDQAVLALAQRVRLPGFLLLYRDAVRPQVLHYRTYRHGHLEYESADRPGQHLERLIQKQGPELLKRSDGSLRQLFGQARGRTTEVVLISGTSSGEHLGKIILWSDEDFSAYTLEIVRLLASGLSQRLLDYNRERIHLSQFFPSRAIDELLRDPAYGNHLRPQDQEVGILFADINGFTRICEQGFDSPKAIGRFVDEWSARAVDFIWQHGGVFDKMVGDCVIGLFGPPFFETSRVQRAEAVVRAALDIQNYTASLSAREEVAELCKRVQLPGLGVAIGVNLAHVNCGLFGPNRNYTAFSTGMNQTARLQSLGGFREMLLMDSAREALAESQAPWTQDLKFGPLIETAVKNVGQPLRYYKLA
ncbi:adenylate/guanylate cyclase domain-containing protein [Hyalangium rubrum]|uniref:Adenylate/guanylate cyclase domain-containing protein n=1 Tax=Hyalangium rubrum TaxID=3103134 RepID=A0ABU5H3E5_9BACT|nr:adenylate/guanylate cyclase domain-containing protein [Hyalangium sp. s54d21]MDY7226615.1 adenylate/guanylate cyclase domain-containing protein [Hyalangium sp. s54d21]